MEACLWRKSTVENRVGMARKPGILGMFEMKTWADSSACTPSTNYQSNAPGEYLKVVSTREGCPNQVFQTVRHPRSDVLGTYQAACTTRPSSQAHQPRFARLTVEPCGTGSARTSPHEAAPGVSTRSRTSASTRSHTKASCGQLHVDEYIH